MSRDFTVQMEGAADLAAALLELPKRATEKAVVRRGLLQVGEPMRGLASALAPFDAEVEGLHLRDSIVVSTKTKARSTLEVAHPGDVTVYIGPLAKLSHHHGIPMEFGTFKDKPQPFMRPAWEATKERTLTDLGVYLWIQIDGAARRAAAKAARLAA